MISKLKSALNVNKKVHVLSRKLNDTEALSQAEAGQMTVHIHKDPITRAVIADEMDPEEKVDPEEIVEEEVDKVALDISDMRKIRQLMDDLRNDLKINVLDNLPDNDLINRMERSYEIYERVDEIRKKYYLAKMRLEEKALYIKHIVDFCLEYAETHEEKEDLKEMLTEYDVMLDEHNHKILVALLEKLQEKTNLLHDNVFEQLPNTFKDIDKVHKSPDMSESEKVGRMIETSINLTVFEKDTVEKLINQILELFALVLDNPKYHHISKAFEEKFEPPVAEDQENQEADKKEKPAKEIGVWVFQGFSVLVASVVLLI
jgi:hypothetical protein